MKVSIIALISTLSLSLMGAESEVAQKVSSSFLGTYRLLTNLEGECPEYATFKEGAGSNYSAWITFNDSNRAFITNVKFDDINAPTKISNDTCMSAGPVNPFCMETRKELTTYDQENEVLQDYYGKKTTYSNAQFRYVRIQKNTDALEVHFKRMEKPLNHAVFSFTPIENGATDMSYYFFPMITQEFKCTYK